MKEDHGTSASGASWDDPTLYERLRQEQSQHRGRGRRAHATASKAPEPLDLRLLTPAIGCWASAWWAVGHDGAGAWRPVLLLASGCAALAAVLIVPVLRFRPPRHRADPRPGAPEQDPGAIGTVSASMLVCALCAAAVLAISAAHLWARQRDPLTMAVASGRPVTLVGTVSQEPRVSATSRATLVITALDVEQVDGRSSSLSATVLADKQWLSLPMGTRVEVRTHLKPTHPGRSETAIIPKRAGLKVLSPPAGVLGAVTSIRTGLARAVGAEDAQGTETASRGFWPPGARTLVPGVALGDDHALPLVAQAACGPLLILLQPTVGAWSVPANLLTEPAAVIATISGLLAALVHPAWPAAATVIAWPALAACSWMVWVAGFFAHLPCATLPWPDGLTGALALGACELGVLLLVAPRARRALLKGLRRLMRPARGRLAPW